MSSEKPASRIQRHLANPMTRNRWLIVILGILMPYLARLPGIPEHGLSWLTSYFGDNLFAPFFFGAFNAVSWGGALLATFTFRQAATAWYPAVFALASSAWLHSLTDLSSDAQAALALVILPFYTIPFTATGWIIGLIVERVGKPRA